MIRSRLARFTCAALLALVCGCAAAGLQPTTSSMPLERQNMPPQYRVFYDALQDDGDWTLIEPYGWVFRPHVNFVAWSPYEYGFWVPSDAYGWVWISTEPFGWATYHYGQWMYDLYQGWVWIPGLDWGPAWVSWEMSSDYVGWAPIMPAGIDPNQIPGGGGGRIWAPISVLGSSNLSMRTVTNDQMGPQATQATRVSNDVERNGVLIHRGPPIDRVESITGPLGRVKLAEVGTTQATKALKRGESASLTPAEFTAQIEATKKAAGDAAREAQGIASVASSIPPRLPVVRPVIVPAPPGTPEPGAAQAPAKRPKATPSAAPDSTRH